MTTPVVAARSTGTGTAGTTTTTVSLPTGITAGDLLVIIVYVISTASAISASSGWTSSTTYTGASELARVFYKVAAGSDTLTITQTTAGPACKYECYRITGASGTVQIAQASGSSTTPAPPTLTPSGGAADYLWLASAGVNAIGATTSTVTAGPSGYSNLQKV